MQNGAAALENNLTVPQKVKHLFNVNGISHDPAILLLGIHPREMKIMSAQKLVRECP